MSVPLVSIAIITYNHEKYIRQCLEGVMMQKTDFVFDVIVGEDCSTDGTRAVIREFEKKYPGIIKPIYHEKNVGAQRNAYEFCLPALKGKYIALCEGDDFWTDPNKLQKQVSFLEKNTNNILCYHPITIIDEQGVVIQKQKIDEQTKLHDWKEIFHLKIPTVSVVFRNCAKIDFREMLRIKSGDTFLFGLLSRYGGAAELNFDGATYRKHAGGVYTRMSLLNQYKQALNTLQVMIDSSSFSIEQKKEIKKQMHVRKRRYIRHFIEKKEILNSLRIVFF